MNSPLITVLMTVYNAQNYIREAIQSILNQTMPNFELLIINDGSTDHSLDIIRSFADSRIRIISLKFNQGLHKCRQLGLTEARGHFFAILDADDIAEPSRLELQMQLLNKRPDVALCTGRAKYIDESGKRIGESPVFDAENNAKMLFGNTLVNSAVMFRTVLAREIGGYGPFAPVEDYDLGLRFAEKYQIYNMSQILVQYRIHSTNISFNSEGLLRVSLHRLLSDLHLRLGSLDPERCSKAHLGMFFEDIPVDFRDLNFLLSNIRSFYKSHKQFDKNLLAQEVFNYWANAIISKGGKASIFMLFDQEMFHGKALTFKMIRRAFKRSFSSLLG